MRIGLQTEIGIASVADIIYLIGGEDEIRSKFSLKYSPMSDRWQNFSILGISTWSELGVVVNETHLYLFGS